MVPMNTYTYTRKQQPEPARISFIGISAGFLLTLIAGILMLVIISSVSSANRILTGVAVNGIDLSGKSVDDATAILTAQQILSTFRENSPGGWR